MEKTHATTNGRDPQKTIEGIDMEVKGDGPEIMTTMALIAKSPLDTKTTATKEVIEEVQDIEATEKRTIKNSPEENSENTTPRQTLQEIRSIATIFNATTIFHCNKSQYCHHFHICGNRSCILPWFIFVVKSTCFVAI
jgi:hypothetical protein